MTLPTILLTLLIQTNHSVYGRILSILVWSIIITSELDLWPNLLMHWVSFVALCLPRACVRSSIRLLYWNCVCDCSQNHSLNASWTTTTPRGPGKTISKMSVNITNTTLLWFLLRSTPLRCSLVIEQLTFLFDFVWSALVAWADERPQR